MSSLGSRHVFVVVVLLLGGCLSDTADQTEPAPSATTVEECSLREPVLVVGGEPSSAEGYVVRLTSGDPADPAVAEQLAVALELGRVGRPDESYFTTSGAAAVNGGMSIFELVDGNSGCESELEIQVGVGARSDSLVFAEVHLLRPRCDLALVRLILDSTSWRVDEITPAGPDQLAEACAIQ